jgi:hypothetical protein
LLKKKSLPDRPSMVRLVGAVLAEQDDEWAEGRRYVGLDILARAQAVDTAAEEVNEATPSRPEPQPRRIRPRTSPDLTPTVVRRAPTPAPVMPLAAERRRLPMVAVDPTTKLIGADGPVPLIDNYAPA